MKRHYDIGDVVELKAAFTSRPLTTSERKTFNEGRGSMTMGWSGTMDQLAAYLSQQRVS